MSSYAGTKDRDVSRKLIGLMKMIRCYICVLLMGVALEGYAQSASPTTISGTVKDITGAVIAEARVMLIQSSELSIKNTTTDGDGKFVFPSVQEGLYTIVVFGPKQTACLGPSTRSLLISKNSKSDLNLVFKLNHRFCSGIS